MGLPPNWSLRPMGMLSSRKPICWKLKARTETELPNSYMPRASLAWTLKPGRDSSIFRPVTPAGAESSASRVMETVAVAWSAPMATEASETRLPVTTSSSTVPEAWASAQVGALSTAATAAPDNSAVRRRFRMFIELSPAHRSWCGRKLAQGPAAK